MPYLPEPGDWKKIDSLLAWAVLILIIMVLAWFGRDGVRIH
jgi:hypothetical protein